ncbi:2'-5' RNA ligase family protein [uncultured Microbacterium sp.]|uniref:2'-5' RNA ligase family protein n=1 Tax=uncultured Microbacterium sp. TaxID=191216 RepID=UPI0028DC28FB|nr:2'-5' RNA ligase family protein [uncultured Microbacterium sp.]
MREPEPRPSPSSIELLLDPAAEAAVRAEWEALAGRGMSSLARHTSPTNRPHLTLLARVDLGDLAPDALEPVAPVPLTLGAPVLFGAGDRRVLARSVVATPELLALHASAHRAAGAGADAPHTAPGEWTPHVTLARRLRLADLEAALDLVGGDIAAEGVGVRRWDPVTATVTMLAELRP